MIKYSHILILLLVMECWIPVVPEGFEKCYCWSEMNTELLEGLLDFANVPKPPEYTYIGIKPKEGGTFASCTCEDVVRFKTNMTIEVLNSTDFGKQELENKVSDQLATLLQTSDIQGDVSDVKATLKGDETSGTTLWVVEVIAKGYVTMTEDRANALVSEALSSVEGDYEFPEVGALEGAIDFSAVKCEGVPVGATQNGQRDWDSAQNFPGKKAFYTCNSGYFLKVEGPVYSECLHSSLAWSSPTNDITCTAGCESDPPQGPFFSTSNWKPTTRHGGDTVVYSCIFGYNAVADLNGTSTCSNSLWTPLNPNFKCEQTLCPLEIPQVPAHGRSDWDKTTRYVNTFILYTCMEGYSPTLMEDVRIFCTTRGDWSPLPGGYDCINNDLAVRLGIFDDTHIRNYDYYEDGHVVDPRVPDRNWFWVVTVPCILGLVLTIFCCMICTRPDSPLFLLCTGNSRKAMYHLG